MRTSVQLLLSLAIVTSMMPLSAAVADLPVAIEQPLSSVPTPAQLSKVFSAACGALLSWELDSTGDVAARAWRSAYAKCAVAAAEAASPFAPIARACQELHGTARGACVSDALVHAGLGPQFSALLEACAVAEATGVDDCPRQRVYDLVGYEIPASGGDECLGDWQMAPPSPSPCKVICDAGLCVSSLIGVDHIRTLFDPDSGACAGAQAATEAEVAATGWIIPTPFFIWWKVKGRATVTVSVTWQVQCDVTAIISGNAWGGFMRQLVIDRGDEGGPVCKYDGLILWSCGLSPGEQWTEPAATAASDTYDVETGDGELPPATMTVETIPGGTWQNTFQGSLQALNLLDVATDVLEGSRDYVVEYGEELPAMDIPDVGAWIRSQLVEPICATEEQAGASCGAIWPQRPIAA